MSKRQKAWCRFCGRNTEHEWVDMGEWGVFVNCLEGRCQVQTEEKTFMRYWERRKKQQAKLKYNARRLSSTT